MSSRIFILAASLSSALMLGLGPSAWAYQPQEHQPGSASVKEEIIPEGIDPVSHDDGHDHSASQEAPMTPDRDAAQAQPDAHIHDVMTPSGHHDMPAPNTTLPTSHDHSGTIQGDPCGDGSGKDVSGGELAEGHDQETASGHAHWGDNGAQTPLEQAIESLGVYHALLVHFPIALILMAALAQAGFLLTGRPSFDEVVRFLVWTGAISGLFAGLFGWAHAGPPASDESGVMLTHRVLGTLLTFGLFIVVGAVEWRRKKPGYFSGLIMNVLVFGSALGVAVNGFLGGSLAHGGIRHLMGG